MRSQRRAMRRPAVSVLPGGGSGFDRDSTRTHHFANCVRAHIPLRRILSVSFRSASSNGTSGAARSPGTPCRCRQWRRPRGRSGLSIRHNDAGACLNTTIPADMGSSTLTYGLSSRCRRCPRGQQASPTVMVTPPLFYQISHSGWLAAGPVVHAIIPVYPHPGRHLLFHPQLHFPLFLPFSVSRTHARSTRAHRGCFALTPLSESRHIPTVTHIYRPCPPVVSPLIRL